MVEEPSSMQTVAVEALGERLSGLRMREPSSLEAMRRSLVQHGQLSALTLFSSDGQLQVVDGFKRLHAARALGLATLLARIHPISLIEAKVRLGVLSERSGLSELEQGWLVRSLYREDGLSLPAIAQLMSRHRSWVWRRLMLVEALDTDLQTDVRLGLLAPRAAVALSRLPRGNQPAASRVVTHRGLTVRQTELLVEQVLAQTDASSRAALLTRWQSGHVLPTPHGPRSTRAVRNEADWIIADALKVRELCARLSARLGVTPLETFTPAVAEVLREGLLELPPVLRALEDVIAAVIERKDVA